MKAGKLPRYTRWQEYGSLYVRRREMQEALYDWARPGEVVLGIIVSLLLITGLFFAAYSVEEAYYRISIFGVIVYIALATLCMAFLASHAIPPRGPADEPGLRERLTPDFATLFGGGGWGNRYGDWTFGSYTGTGYYWGYDTNPAWVIFYLLLIGGLQSIPRIYTTGTGLVIAGFIVLLIVSALLLPILIGWFSWYGYAIAVAPFRALQMGFLESRYSALEEEVKREFQGLQRLVQSETTSRNGARKNGFRPMTFTDYWVNGQFAVALAGFNLVWLEDFPEGEDLGRWVDSLELIAGLRPSSADPWVRQLTDLDQRLAEMTVSSEAEQQKTKALRQMLRPLALMKLRWVGRSAFSPQSLQALMKFLYDSPPEMLILPAFLKEMRELGKRWQAVEPMARLTEQALSVIPEREIIAQYRQIRDTAERSQIADSLEMLRRYLTGSDDFPNLPPFEEAKSQLTAWAEQGPPNLRAPSRVLLHQNWILTEQAMNALLQEPLPVVPLFYRVLGGWLAGASADVSLEDYFLWALAFLERVREVGGEREVGAGLWFALRDRLMAVSASEAQRRLSEERAAIQSLLKPPVSVDWSAIPEDLVSVPAAV
jgi:hypothetical protein